MRIFYLINSRIPTDKAEGLEAMKLCEALAETAEIIFVSPRRLNSLKEDPFAFYGVKKTFRIVRLPVIDLMPYFPTKMIFRIEALSYSLAAFFYLIFKTDKNDIIFSHDRISLSLVAAVKTNTFYDMHDFPERRSGSYRSLFSRVRGVTTTNNWKKRELIKNFGLAEDKIMAWPNGVDLDKFDIGMTKAQARERLGLPPDKAIVGYVGMLKTMGMEKGIDTAIEAAKLLPDDVALVLVGGKQEDVDHYKGVAAGLGLSARVFFAGWVAHDRVPVYLKAFDIAIAPFPKTEHYDHYMSPMKIFEYMAAGVPIVASDLESIRELLSSECAVLIKPDSAQDLADGATRLLNGSLDREKITAKAFETVKRFSWQARALAINNFINKKKYES